MSASIPILGSPDLGMREQLNVVLQKLTVDPGSPVEGLLYYKDDTDRVRIRIAGSWKDLAFTDDVVSALADNSVTNAKLADMAAGTVKANITGGSADPVDVTKANFITWLALSLADISGDGALAALNSVGAAQIDDLSVGTAELAARAVTLAKFVAASTNNRVLGRITAGSGDWEELTGANIRTILGTLDADTLGGNTAAAIVTSAVNQITNGAGAAYDTLIEIQNILTTDEGTVTALTTTVAGKAKKGVAADLGTASADAVHNHALGTRDVICQLQRKSDWKFVIAPFTVTDTNNVTWNLDAAPSAGQYRSIVLPAI